MTNAEQRYALRLAEEAERARARTTFAAGMVGGLGLTLAGNLALPLVSESVTLSLVAFALPPLLAGWGAHMALTVHRAAPRTEAGKRAANGAVALAVVLFGIALVASYSHLRAVFIIGGYAPWLASVFAAAIDLALLAATAAWFSMRPASDAELRALRAELEAEDEAKRKARAAAAKAEADAERARQEALRADREAREAELERARLAAEAETERARIRAEIEAERVRAEIESEREAREAEDARQARAHEEEMERLRIEAQERERAERRADAQRVIERSRPSAVEPELDHRFAAQAEAAHRAGVARRTPVEKVAAALELIAEGEPNGAVERETRVHRDTVQRLREWFESAAESAA